MLFVPTVVFGASSTIDPSHNSVDSHEIRWGGSTKYSDYFNYAVNKWNGLGAVYIAPDTAYTIEDLTVSDYYSSTDGWAAKYTYNFIGADYLRFNNYSMPRLDSYDKKHASLHEFGHAIGLMHTWYPNVMVNQVMGLTELGSRDKSDYHELWGY
jgi:hypothetical protein